MWAYKILLMNQYQSTFVYSGATIILNVTALNEHHAKQVIDHVLSDKTGFRVIEIKQEKA